MQRVPDLPPRFEDTDEESYQRMVDAYHDALQARGNLDFAMRLVRRNRENFNNRLITYLNLYEEHNGQLKLGLEDERGHI